MVDDVAGNIWRALRGQAGDAGAWCGLLRRAGASVAPAADCLHRQGINTGTAAAAAAADASPPAAPDGLLNCLLTQGVHAAAAAAVAATTAAAAAAPGAGSAGQGPPCVWL
jgi:hypothetical protein